MSLSKILYEGGASNVLFTDRREFYPESEVFEYWKNLTQFLTFVEKVGKLSVPDPLYKNFEDTPTFQNQYLFNNGSTVTIASNGTESDSVNVDNITNITQAGTADDSMIGLLFEVWDANFTVKRGQCFISDVASTTAVKFKTVKGTAINTVDNDVFKVIGTVRGEKSVAGESYYNELKVIWNSTHYFSLPVEVTGKLYKETKLKGRSDELGRLREKKFKEMKYQVQSAFLKSSSTVGTNFNSSDTFSEASLRTITDTASNTSSVRTTYGYIPILEDYGITWTGNGAMDANTNIFKMSASALDFDKFTDMTRIIFDKRESDVIPGFCGYKFLGDINKKVIDGAKFGFKGQVQLGDMSINGLGFNVRDLFTPFGRIQLIPTKALDNEYGGYCLLPNDQAIGIAEYEPWQYLTNIKTDNNYNGVKDVINYDAGLRMNLLPTHHIIVLQ
jgi:hypothetical protein